MITADKRLRTFLMRLDMDTLLEDRILSSLLRECDAYRDIHEDVWYAQRTPKFDKSE